MKWLRIVTSVAAACAIAPAFGQPKDVYGTSACMGCHGINAMGGLGPPIAKTKVVEDQFVKIVRDGRGMMPTTPGNQLSDAQIARIFDELQGKEWRPEEIPISYKVGSLLTTKSISHVFLAVFLFSAIFAIRGLLYWIRLAGLRNLRPALRKLGYGRAIGIGLKALALDGFFVRSLWRRSRTRWLMHGLMLYGFVGLMLVDIAMQITNPARSHLAVSHPLKLAAIVAGSMVLVGVLYVMRRYRVDAYIDNGLTLGKDYVFVTLLFHTVLSGIFTLLINRTTSHQWVMPIYLYHIGSISALIISAPFTRFQHMWVVPTMVALTRVTDAVAASGVDIGFSREPSPGRHHKSVRIAEDVMARVAPELSQEVKLRYYP